MAGTLNPKFHTSAFQLEHLHFFNLTLRARAKQASSFQNIDGIAAIVGFAIPGSHYPATKQDKRDQRWPSPLPPLLN